MRLPAAVSLLALLAPLGVACASPGDAENATAAPPAARSGVSLRVSEVRDGLSHPWDVRSIGDGRLLLTQRSPAALTVVGGGRSHDVAFPTGRIWQAGETGLMGLAVDPGYARNHRFYTCSGWLKGANGQGGHDVRVNAWRMNGAATKATLIRPLLTGFPTSSGRHGGCRLLIDRAGSLLVGTGDAAVGTNPQDLTGLGGKTLRMDRFSGKPWPSNPFRKAKNLNKRFIQTYGHRNVQGLAQRKDGTLWSIEQGTGRDDEVNLLRNGGNYGWNPVPGYDESTPMTNYKLPGRQLGARWSSGNPTIATSGGTFVNGKRWGRFNGTLAVAALKGERVVFLRFDRSGRLKHAMTPDALRQYGRIRTVVQAPDGDLLVLTDGDGADGRLLRVRPA